LLAAARSREVRGPYVRLDCRESNTFRRVPSLANPRGGTDGFRDETDGFSVASAAPPSVTTAIWFDLDGTLVPFPDYGAVLATACEAVGIGDADAFAAAYNDAFFDYFGDLTPEPYRRAAADALAAVDADAAPEPFVAAVRDAEFGAAEAPPVVRRTLSTLAAADGVALGVCTNGVPEWQREKLRESGLAAHVDATVVSYETGAHKPAPEPFDRAEALIEADRRVMIGDGEESDVVGARERGWEAVHVDGPADVPAAVDAVR